MGVYVCVQKLYGTLELLYMHRHKERTSTLKKMCQETEGPTHALPVSY